MHFLQNKAFVDFITWIVYFLVNQKGTLSKSCKYCSWVDSCPHLVPSVNADIPLILKFQKMHAKTFQKHKLNFSKNLKRNILQKTETKSKLRPSKKDFQLKQSWNNEKYWRLPWLEDKKIFLNVRSSRMAKIVTFLSWWYPVQSFWFETFF